MNIEDFLKYLRYELNLSAYTVLCYKNDLSQLVEFLSRGEESEFEPESVTAADVRAWIAWLSKRGIASRSIRRKVQAVRAYYKYLMRRGIAEENPAAEAELAKVRRRLPQVVREKNINELLDEEIDESDFESVRDKLIMMMFYETGIRRAELIGLTDANVDTSAMQIKVHGKRNKDRIVPFGSELCALICRYRRLRASLASPGVGELLLTKKGAALYPSLVYNVVHDELAAAGVRGAKSPHVMRHSFATAMLNDGAEINSVKQILGHESLAATQVYTHITFSELKNNYQLAHPRALKKGG